MRCTDASLSSRRTVRYRHQLSNGERRQVAVRCEVGKLVSKEVVVNQMRVVGESLSLSSARRECGLVAGDQSAARLARVIIGHVGGNVHTVAVAREMVVYSLPLVRELALTLNAARLRTVFLMWYMVVPRCSL